MSEDAKLLAEEIERYVRQLAPHIKDREAGLLLARAAARLKEAYIDRNLRIGYAKICHDRNEEIIVLENALTQLVGKDNPQ